MFQNKELLEGSIWSVLLWFGSHTGNTRLKELLYVVVDIWPGIVSPYEFQYFILA